MMVLVLLNFRKNRAFLTCMCLMAVLVLSLALGLRSSATGHSPAGASVQQLSAAPALPSIPHRFCPLGALSKGSGPCVSLSFVGLKHSSADQAVLAEPKSSRFEIAAASAVSKFLASRLERPPRF